MPKYKLTYFDFAGRAESTRWIFAVAGVDYIDERLTREEFAKRKPGESFSWDGGCDVRVALTYLFIIY